MKALVTGDLGFLGSHFRAALERRGYQVEGLDIRRAASQDCRDYLRSNVALRKGAHFDLVVHAAAVAKGRDTTNADPMAMAANMAMDAEMFRWASIVRPGRVVYLSSPSAYPIQFQWGTYRRLSEPDLGLHRAWIGQPDGIHGWAKVAGERLALQLRELDVPVTVVRPFHGYGPGQAAEYPVPHLLEQVRNRVPVVQIRDSRFFRDFVHVDDIVGATLAAVDSRTDHPVNICSGRAVSFYDLARMLGMRVERTLPLGETYRPVYEGSPSLPMSDRSPRARYRVGSPERMREIYSPIWTLERGLDDLVGTGAAEKAVEAP